ncbi:MAG: N-acetyl-gamma-glutamyl-phosphate reductase [Tissierella sp.]|uniref:N-acetyl-gamma-glutamyl-phosphate reductase n=1 Tax=Tissierella sp. TaxID=41274 RepID=UPI003F9CDE25
MIKVAVVGSTGYVGTEIIRLLINNPEVELKYITSKTYEGESYSSIYENYRDVFTEVCTTKDLEKIAEEVDLIFMALPHGLVSNQINKSILEKAKVIDLSADYRLKDKKVYESWYKTEHGSPERLEKSVYGLCEKNRKDIKEARLVANPGCYPTASILSLMPLLGEDMIEKNNIIIDAKSGVTGAGRSLNLGSHFTECNESIKAYSIGSHRHTPEIEEQLGSLVNFTPHLIPMNRGILTTSYVNLKEKLNYRDIKKIYEKYYSGEYFIRLTKENIFPQTKWVKGSNFCDIGFKVDARTNRLIVVGAIDNMIKGSAGQAIQNMNIMFGLKENRGLEDVSMFPI